MDRDRYITINGNTYLQLGLISAELDANKTYGITSSTKSTGVGELVEIGEGGSITPPIDNHTIQLSTDGKLFARRSEVLEGLETLLISKNILTLQDIQTIDPEYQP